MGSDGLSKTLSLVKKYLKTDDANFEKLGYKLLIKLMPKMHSSFTKVIIEIFSISN
jgi:hypothetical protein